MAAFELNGEWSYTGGEIAVGGLTETLVINDKSMLDQGDYKGTSWTISYKVDSYDNDGDRAQLTVASVEGFSHYAVGEELYMSWQLAGNVAKLYFAGDAFPRPTGGAEGEAFFTYTRQ